MYEDYFGLKRPPFRITPDTSLFYEGGRRGDILAALAYAVQRGEGIIKVVGEVGSGKTMLCRMLQQVLPEDVEIIYIANPSVSPEDILYVIASELHFDVERDASKHELVARLQDYLLQRHAENRQVVLFIEEAQGMPLETLEEIRLLSNLETDQHKLLQIILFGQPELDENLAQKSIRQLRERITHEFRLAPLDADEIHKYLNFRMREVGYTGPELIDRKLAREIARHSEGLLRRVNILADKMLLAAYAGDTHTLTSRHLKKAVADSGFTRLGVDGKKRYAPLFWSMVAAVLILALLVIYRMASDGVSTVWATAKDAGTEAAAEPRRKTAARNSPLAGKTGEAIAGGQVQAGQRERENSWEQPQPTPVRSSRTGARGEPSQTGEPGKMASGSKKNTQPDTKLDKVDRNQPVGVAETRENRVLETTLPYDQWLEQKLLKSKSWLEQAPDQEFSIQVMVRSQNAARILVNYLRNEWPEDLEQTHVFSVYRPEGSIYRVFFGEYPSISAGQQAIRALPDAVRVNAPYLHSIYQMKKQLLDNAR